MNRHAFNDCRPQLMQPLVYDHTRGIYVIGPLPAVQAVELTGQDAEAVIVAAEQVRAATEARSK